MTAGGQNKLTRPVYIVAHPFDTWVTGPVVDRATRLDERETIGHVELAIQLNAAVRPHGGPWPKVVEVEV